MRGLSRPLSVFGYPLPEDLDPVLEVFLTMMLALPPIQLNNFSATTGWSTKTNKIRTETSNCKTPFRNKKVDTFGQTIRLKQYLLETTKLTRFLGKIRNPSFKKPFQDLIDFIKYYQNYQPRLAAEFNFFFQLSKTTRIEGKDIIMTRLMIENSKINAVWDYWSQLALRPPRLSKQKL